MVTHIWTTPHPLDGKHHSWYYTPSTGWEQLLYQYPHWGNTITWYYSPSTRWETKFEYQHPIYKMGNTVPHPIHMMGDTTLGTTRYTQSQRLEKHSTTPHRQDGGHTPHLHDRNRQWWRPSLLVLLGRTRQKQHRLVTKKTGSPWRSLGAHIPESPLSAVICTTCSCLRHWGVLYRETAGSNCGSVHLFTTRVGSVACACL